ncbi:MAG: hypothetical protein ACRCZF_08400 [Gemmataceae bacterium]
MPVPPTEMDRILLDRLKEVHNQGADLYNNGDGLGALRVYQGALGIAVGFLPHRPFIRQYISDGLEEVQQADGNVYLRAFRLHEIIEQIRADLKLIVRGRDPSQTDRMPELSAATLRGTLHRHGMPLPGAVIMLTAPGDAVVSAAAVVGPDGAFLVGALPGDYLVTVTGPEVPVRYQSLETTPLRYQLGENGGLAAFSLDSAEM